MSKQSLLTLANFNLFRNSNDQIEFSIAKDNRVMATYSAYDKSKGYDVRGIRAKSSSGVGYIRLSISMVDGNGNREYHNGALFVNDKKQSDKHPDFQGSVNLDNNANGPKLRLSAWKKKGEKAGEYLSISIQEFKQGDEKENSSGNTGDDAFDMSNASTPEKKSSPARKTAQKQEKAPARRAAPAPAPAPAGDSLDDDIPF